MKNYRIDLDNLVRQLLPVHKRRGANRLAILRSFISPLKEKYRDFEEWRKDQRRKINITGQIFVLENYLRHKYNHPEIYIVTHDEEGWQIGLLEFEAGLIQSVGLSSESEPSAVVALIGERTAEIDGADFKVEITLTDELLLRWEKEDTENGVEYDFEKRRDDFIRRLRVDVNKYKMALVSYKLIINYN